MGTNKLGKKNIQDIKQNMDKGMLPQWVVTDPEIYELEKEGIFAKTWQFLGHESEIEKPGSYVTRWMVDDPVILVKNRSGDIKAFLNSCAHRGTQLCTADFGQRRAITCPYHGWTYSLDGDLIGISSGNEIFGENMQKDEWGLRPIPRVESYQGMIFGNLDSDAMSLDEYLGDIKWYLDIMLGRSDGGMEVRGVPQRWVTQANWKMTAENFTADPYHVQSTHRSTVELGISPDDPDYAGYGYQVVCENGHGLSCITSSTGQAVNKYQGMPKSMWPMFEKNLSPEQSDLLSKITTFVGGVFPNFAFISPIHGSEGELHNYLSLRVWRPLGPDKVEIWSWFLIDKAAPEDFKEKAYKGYISSFGPSGTLEQDDTEIWARIVAASNSIMVRDKELNYNNVNNYLMGFGHVDPDETFQGPGVAYPTCYLDNLARNIHENWFNYISRYSSNVEGMSQ